MRHAGWTYAGPLDGALLRAKLRREINALWKHEDRRKKALPYKTAKLLKEVDRAAFKLLAALNADNSSDVIEQELIFQVELTEPRTLLALVPGLPDSPAKAEVRRAVDAVRSMKKWATDAHEYLRSTVRQKSRMYITRDFFFIPRLAKLFVRIFDRDTSATKGGPFEAFLGETMTRLEGKPLGEDRAHQLWLHVRRQQPEATRLAFARKRKSQG
jgi:hypothetical protein